MPIVLCDIHGGVSTARRLGILEADRSIIIKFLTLSAASRVKRPMVVKASHKRVPKALG